MENEYYNTHLSYRMENCKHISCSFFIPLPHFKLTVSWSYNILCKQCVRMISAAWGIRFHCVRCSKGLNIICTFGWISILLKTYLHSFLNSILQVHGLVTILMTMGPRLPVKGQTFTIMGCCLVLHCGC
jgi:hypothetical protein